MPVVGLIVLACGPTRDPGLEREILQTPEGAVLDLSQLVRREWDRLCIVTPYSTPDRAQQITGATWSGFDRSGIQHRDDVYLLAFIRDMRVIHSALVSRRLDFSVTDITCFPADSAKFEFRSDPHRDGARLIPRTNRVTS